MKRFMKSHIFAFAIGLVILLIIMPILYFTGTFGPEDAKDPIYNTESASSIEPTESTESSATEHEDIEVEEETFLLEIEKQIAEDQKNDPNAIPDPGPDHKHVYNNTVISPSCNRQGYTLYSCECGDTYKDDVKDKLTHSYTSQVISPTEESKGYTLYTCSICGDEYQDNFIDPIKGNSTTSKPTDSNPVEPTPYEPEITTPKPSEPIKSEQAEYIPTPDEEDYSNPEHEENDHGDCPKCGRHLWTYWDQTGCFTFLDDTTCDCGEFVEAGECHHH